MGQSVRQAARRQALESQAMRRRDRAAAEKRRSALGVDVVVALGERDAAVERHERAAGAALVTLTRDEGLTVTEACEWAGYLSAAEAKRLRRLAETDISGATEDSGSI
jgi:hypothetical protein